MLPFPPPILPEPLSVKDNVADADYGVRVRFVRLVSLLNLASAGAIGLGIWFLLQPGNFAKLPLSDPEIYLFLSVAGLVSLSVARQSSVAIQVASFAALLCGTIPFASYVVGFLHDAFPYIIEGAAIAAASAWTALVLYNLLCFWDHSLYGEFLIAAAAAIATAIPLALFTEMGFGEGFTASFVILAGLFYWTYDLAMILRRRTAAEPIFAAIDFYRDLLNFVGFPVRVLRMPRRGRTAH
jgi:hypothetical protein